MPAIWSSNANAADLAGNITTLENKYVRTTRFESISSGTSGTVTLPPSAEVVLDDFGGTVDAVVTGISGGRPTTVSVVTAGGVVVATTFDSSGNWVFTGTPSAYPVAIVYRVRQTLVNFDSNSTDIWGMPSYDGISGIGDPVARGTDTRVLFAGTGPVLADSSAFTFGSATNQLALSGTGTGAGVLVGGDTQLYRRAADIMSLASGDSLEVPDTFAVGTTVNTTRRIEVTRSSNVSTSWQNFRSNLNLQGTTSDGHFPTSLQNEVGLDAGSGTTSWVVCAFNRIRYYQQGNVSYSVGFVNEMWSESGSSGTVTEMGALYNNINCRSGAGGTVTRAYSSQSTLSGEATNARNITTYQGLVSIGSWASGTVTTLQHVRIQNVTGAGTITTQIGLSINSLSNGASNRAIDIEGSGTGNAINFNSQSVLIYSSASALANVTGGLTVSKATNSGVSTLTDGATPALDAALGNTFVLTTAGNRTIAVPTNPVDGQKIVILHTVAAIGSRTLALNTGTGGFAFGTDITALTATPSGLTDYISCMYSAAANKWRVIAYVKGY